MILHQLRRYPMVVAAVILGTAVMAFLQLRSRASVRTVVPGISPATISNQQAGTPVLVELFTSEGCSSCPPADALLASLDRTQPVAGAHIVILEEHVDYWDSLGWKDRFSSPAFTQRQRDYGTSFRLPDVYTPQMVVNGARQFNGSDISAARKAIQEQATAAHAVPLPFQSVSFAGSTVGFTLQSGSQSPETVDLYAAVVEPQAQTEVRAGENGGRTLYHAGVARSFGRVASGVPLHDLATRPFELSLASPSPPALKGAPEESPEGMRLVVFAQARHTGQVLGIASCTFRQSPGRSETSPSTNRCPTPSI